MEPRPRRVTCHVAPFCWCCGPSIFWNFARGLLRQRQNWRFSLRRTVALGNGAGAPRRAQHTAGAPRSAQHTARAEGGHEARHPKFGRVESRERSRGLSAAQTQIAARSIQSAVGAGPLARRASAHGTRRRTPGTGKPTPPRLETARSCIRARPCGPPHPISNRA